jgi:hypothetical protein
MNRQEITKADGVEPDVAFLDSLEIEEEPAWRRLEVYEEARQLRREVFWFEDEPASPAPPSR